jgi:pilus assembly protein Flp/PilA
MGSEAMERIIRILRCRRGATAIEYALVASLISIAAIGAMNGLGDQIDSVFHNVGNALDDAG